MSNISTRSGRKPRSTLTEVGDRPDQQAGADEQRKREGDLRQNERPAQTAGECDRRYRPARVGQRSGEARARTTERGSDAEADAGEKRAARQRT